MAKLRETVYPTDAEAPETVMGYISVAAASGATVLEGDSPTSAEPFRCSPEALAAAEHTLVEDLGFQVVARSGLGLAVAGSAGAYEELTGGTVQPVERFMHAEMGRRRYVGHLDIVGGDQPDELGIGRARHDLIDAVILERPRIPFAASPSPLAPSVSKFHLRVPDDVAMLLNALAAHRDGWLGKDVRVAMVDSGHYAHPFFNSHGYNVRPPIAVVPGTSATHDPSGHGTGESANVFALAPAAILEPYRASNDRGRLVASIAAFLQAKASRPQILTNSWGGDAKYDPKKPSEPLRAYARAWAAEIIDAVEQGIVVVFAAGNGSFGIEAQVPAVLSAGGAYVSQQLQLRASSYASGYASPYYRERIVPDLCGLVGLLPRAQYLMLPVEPGCRIDVDESLPADGEGGDGTASDDGWALFSGTSAAAPQIAGAAALILGANPGLTPAQVRDVMVETAIDVRTGRNNPIFDEPAGPGPDLATGAGLLNASAAVRLALER
jgi:subtilisin family serine protease